MEQESVSTIGLVQDPAESELTNFPSVSQIQLAYKDLEQGLRKWKIWFLLAYQDIKLRYRRSILGPLWITLSMGITVYSMGFLYSRLFHIELHVYFPFLVAGMLAWSLISTLLTEFTDSFINADGLIKQIKLPYSLYIHRTIARNMLIFFHNVLVYIPIIIIFHDNIKIDRYSLLLLPGLILIYFNAMTFGLLLAMVASRYRDVAQIIKSIIQVIFFVTPVMWAPDILGARGNHLVNLNPFYAFLELIRAPLLGRSPTLINYAVVLLITVIGILLSSKVFIRYRARIIYWL